MGQSRRERAAAVPDVAHVVECSTVNQKHRPEDDSARENRGAPPALEGAIHVLGLRRAPVREVA